MAEKEYIEREAALAECDWYANEFSECEYAIMPLKGALEILPASDVRPVVRGKWEPNVPPRDLRQRCSVCGELQPRKTNFCPDCGADMREERGGVEE